MEVLKGSVREEFGSRPTRRLRKAGMVPGVLYGHGKENISFAVSRHDLDLLLSHGERLVELDLDGKSDTYLIKDVQRDAFDHYVIHVDFARVAMDETVEVTVPVVLRGTAAGEADGGVVNPGATELSVECLVTQIPEEIRVGINDLNVGDTLRVKDLPEIEGGKILTSPETIIASCQVIAEAPEPEEAPEVAEGESAEPEVIGRGAKEDEEESAES